jgi:hypothetical protein
MGEKIGNPFLNDGRIHGHPDVAEPSDKGKPPTPGGAELPAARGGSRPYDPAPASRGGARPIPPPPSRSEQMRAEHRRRGS